MEEHISALISFINSPEGRSITDVLTGYFRLVSYAIVLTLSIVGFKKTRYTQLLMVANIVMSIGLILAICFQVSSKFNSTWAVSVFATPAVVGWMIVNIYAFFRK